MGIVDAGFLVARPDYALASIHHGAFNGAAQGQT